MSPSIDGITKAPATDTPSVTISGVAYQMKIGMLAHYELSMMRLEPASIWFVSESEQKVASFAHVLRLFRASIAHNFVMVGKPVPSPEQMALMLDGESSEKLGEITNKVIALFFPKIAALTQTVKLQESAPAPGQQPN